MAEVHVVPQQNFSQIQIIRAGFQGREVFLLRPAVQRDRDARLAQLGSNLIGCLRPVRAVGAVEQRQREARALPGQARVGQQLLGRLQVPRLDRRCAQQGKIGVDRQIRGLSRGAQRGFNQVGAVQRLADGLTHCGVGVGGAVRIRPQKEQLVADDRVAAG